MDRPADKFVEAQTLGRVRVGDEPVERLSDIRFFERSCLSGHLQVQFTPSGQSIQTTGVVPVLGVRDLVFRPNRLSFFLGSRLNLFQCDFGHETQMLGPTEGGPDDLIGPVRGQPARWLTEVVEDFLEVFPHLRIGQPTEVPNKLVGEPSRRNPLFPQNGRRIGQAESRQKNRLAMKPLLQGVQNHFGFFGLMEPGYFLDLIDQQTDPGIRRPIQTFEKRGQVSGPVVLGNPVDFFSFFTLNDLNAC